MERHRCHAAAEARLPQLAKVSGPLTRLQPGLRFAEPTYSIERARSAGQDLRARRPRPTARGLARPAHDPRYDGGQMRALGEWSTTERVSVADCADLAVAALGALNCARPNGRFESYIAIMREFAALPFPCALPWDADKQTLFFEAASQVTQLIAAARVWPVLPPDVVTNKMRRVLAGNSIPDPNLDVDADARNILLEFATACLVRAAGFAVSMTIEREDVRGSL